MSQKAEYKIVMWLLNERGFKETVATSRWVSYDVMMKLLAPLGKQPIMANDTIGYKVTQRTTHVVYNEIASFGPDERE